MQIRVQQLRPETMQINDLCCSDWAEQKTMGAFHSAQNWMERTISVQFDWNIWDYLWRWSLSTGPTGPKCPFPFDIIIVLNVALCILITSTITKCTVAWVGLSVCNRNALFYWAYRISEILNRNFCWMERNVPEQLGWIIHSCWSTEAVIKPLLLWSY